jgi:hypothetical protein
VIDVSGIIVTCATEVFILFKKPDGTVVQEECSIVDSEKGIVEYTLGTTEIQVVGTVTGTVFITDNDGGRLTFSSLLLM